MTGLSPEALGDLLSAFLERLPFTISLPMPIAQHHASGSRFHYRAGWDWPRLSFERIELWEQGTAHLMQEFHNRTCTQLQAMDAGQIGLDTADG